MADNELAAYLDNTLSPERRADVERLLDGDLGALETVAVCAAKPGEASGHRLYPGARLGRLQVVRRIASGGMGSVYEAYDPQLERHVALKFPRESALQSSQVEDEARRLAAITHPNVVTVHDVGRYGGRVYMTMEYLDGLDLRTHLRSQPMTWRAIVDLYLQVGEALVAVHDAGLVHRDIKPDNILVERPARAVTRPRAVMVDFGLATAAGLPVALAGTPNYMAPEVLAGASPSEASDQFAFATSMLEALSTGGAKGAAGLPGPVDAVPRRLLNCVRTGCSQQVSQRHPSMRALLTAIDQARQARVGGAALVIGLCLSGAVVLGLATRAEPPPSFCPLAARTEALDNATEQVEDRFESQPTEYIRDLGPKVGARLRARRDSIQFGRLDNCEQRRAGESSRADWSARQACYDRRAGELLAISQALADPAAGEDLLGAALASLAELDHPADCATATPQQRSAVADDGYAHLAAAALTMRAGRDDQTADHLDGAARSLEGDPNGELSVLHRRAKWLEIRGDYDGAEDLLERGVLEAERSGDARRIASLMIEQVWVVGYRQQDFDRAREIATHARAWVERSSKTRILSFELELNLGWLELTDGQPDEALEHFRASQRLLDAPGLDGRDASLVANGLGSAHLALGDPIAAAEQLAGGLEAMQHELGALHPDVGQMRNNLAAVTRSLGKFELAKQYFDANLETFRRAYGEHHPFVGITLLNRATLLVDLGEFEPAQRDARGAVAVYETLVESDESHAATLARARKILVDVLVESGDARSVEEAGPLIQLVIEQQLESLGPKNPLLAESRHALARWHHARGDSTVAIEQAEAAQAIIVGALGDDHPSLAPISVSLGLWKDDPGALERAATLSGPLHCAQAHISWAIRLDADGHTGAARHHARWAEACYRWSPGPRAVLSEIRAFRPNAPEP